MTCCGNLIHSYQEEFKPYTNGTISTQTTVSHERNLFTSTQDTPVLLAENWVQENVHRISDNPRGVKTSWYHSMISCSNRQRVWMRFTWRQLTSLRSSIQIVRSPYLPCSSAHTRIGSTIGYASSVRTLFLRLHPQQQEIQMGKRWEKLTKIRSNRVAWSTFTKSWSQALTSSSGVAGLSSVDFWLSTWYLQYSITFARILLETLGNGIGWSTPVSSIMFFTVCDSKATASSTSNISSSELFSFTRFSVMVPAAHTPGVVGRKNTQQRRTHTHKPLRGFISALIEPNQTEQKRKNGESRDLQHGMQSRPRGSCTHACFATAKTKSKTKRNEKLAKTVRETSTSTRAERPKEGFLFHAMEFVRMIMPISRQIK